MFGKDDTIVALATPAGSGAIAIIRLSGIKAVDIADSVFQMAKGLLSEVAVRTVHFGKIKSGDNIIDEVLAVMFHAPSSYTGEHIVEFSCHGSVFVQQEIIQLLINKGARLATPGEFTLRGFLNGKMDLSQAEAVADLIASDSASSHDLALKQMRGGYSTELKHLREQLINFASLIELELDFSEEDVEFANRKQLLELISNLQKQISALLESFKIGNAVKQGVPVVIAGKPNAGKSTLLNALVNEERAIVSHIPGTTRDTVEEEIILSGIKFRFIDTAGIRATTDTIESLGVNRTFEKIRQSPVLLYLFDVSNTNSLDKELDELKSQVNIDKINLILVGNKIDATRINHSASDTIYISAKKGENINELINKLLTITGREKLNQSGAIVTNARHAEALQKTAEHLQKAKENIENNVSGDLLAADIRYALHHLGEITGQITTDHLLETIFSKFCIGK